MDKVSLTRSIIHGCPALKMPTCPWSNSARIVALVGASAEDADFIVAAINEVIDLAASEKIFTEDTEAERHAGSQFGMGA